MHANHAVARSWLLWSCGSEEGLHPYSDISPPSTPWLCVPPSAGNTLAVSPALGRWSSLRLYKPCLIRANTMMRCLSSHSRVLPRRTGPSSLPRPSIDPSAARQVPAGRGALSSRKISMLLFLLHLGSSCPHEQEGVPAQRHQVDEQHTEVQRDEPAPSHIRACRMIRNRTGPDRGKVKVHF